jgi:hypothetical protein
MNGLQAVRACRESVSRYREPFLRATNRLIGPARALLSKFEGGVYEYREMGSVS